MGLMAVMVMMMTSLCQGVYVVLPEGHEKCYIEEVPVDTLILCKFKIEQTLGLQGELLPVPSRWAEMGMKVVVKDPVNEVVLDRSMDKEGRFALNAQVGGEHTICFSTNTTRWFGRPSEVKMMVSIKTGVEATDYEEIAKLEHLNALEVSVRRLHDRVRSIMSEQNYQRKREARFRDTSEAANSRVMWWSVIQICILLATGFWQIRHLKNFFRKKKLV